MNDDWPMWTWDDPMALAHYVLPAAVRSLVEHTADGTPGGLPGKNANLGPLVLARQCYDTLKQVGIQYAHEQLATAYSQLPSTPIEVLFQPRRGNCLDISLVFAAACQDAGVRPIIALLHNHDSAHALVIIDVQPAHDDCDDNFPALVEPGENGLLPVRLKNNLIAAADRTLERYLPIDVEYLASHVENGRRVEPKSFDEAVHHGYEILTSGEWTWDPSVDLGLAYDPARVIVPSEIVHAKPLSAPYSGSERFTGDTKAQSALRLMDPRSDTVDFAPRYEYLATMDYIGETKEVPGIHLIVVSGIGGAGKTRMAAQIAHDLAEEGWITGFLRNKSDTTSTEQEWLAHTTAPLLVIVDYPEAQELLDSQTDQSRPLGAILQDRHKSTQTYVMLTTRRELTDEDGRTTSWWHDPQTHFGPHADFWSVAMPPYLDKPMELYSRASSGFRQALKYEGEPPVYDPRNMSPLEIMLLAWMALQADAPTTQPTTTQLLNRVSEHEVGYWVRTYKNSRQQAAAGSPDISAEDLGVPTLDPDDAREAAACLSLLRPQSDRVEHVLKAIPALAGKHQKATRRRLKRVLGYLVGDDHEVTVRPDRVGEFLAAQEILPELEGMDISGESLPTNPSEKLHCWLEEANDYELFNALLVITRLAETDEDGAYRLAWAVLADDPYNIDALFYIGRQIGGPCARVLDDMARTMPEFIPAEKGLSLAQQVHFGSANLRTFAAAMVTLYGVVPENPGEAQVWALIDQSMRINQAGDTSTAVESAQQAVLASEALTAGTTPNDASDMWATRAAAIDTLSIMLSNIGDRDRALTLAQEASNLCRTLQRHNPTAFTPVLAESLTNLASRLSAAGERDQALAAAQEAVELYRTLTTSDYALFSSHLAGSLAVLATMYSYTGNHNQALVTVQEAVKIRRQLAHDNPSAFTPNLAESLNDLAAILADTGNFDEALPIAQEAVETNRRLVHSDPAAFTPGLAMSLNNLANILSHTGERDQALATTREATNLYRELAHDNPTAFTINLAMSLSNLSAMLFDTGNPEALTAIEESVELSRKLAHDNPMAFTPNLATSLNNLANMLSDMGGPNQALAPAQEATDLFRELVHDNPMAFTPNLAASLNNLASILSKMGERHQALITTQEAVELYRKLVHDNATKFKPNLTTVLNNLAAMFFDTGNPDQALTAIQESVELLRELAHENPVAFTPNLAMSLNNLAAAFSGIGKRDEALTAIRESVNMYRALAHDNPETFNPDLSLSLTTLSAMESDSGYHQQALAAAQEAVGIRRALALENPAKFTPDLALSLVNLAGMLLHMGAPDQALVTQQEATELFRKLAHDNPAAFTPDLAGSLNNLASLLTDSAHDDQTLASAQESVELFRKLAHDNPPKFTPDLAMSLNTLANVQLSVGDREHALPTALESVEIRRKLALDNTAKFNPDLATSLNTLATIYSSMGDHDQALTAIQEAVTLRRNLAKANPLAFQPDLVWSLTTFTRIQADDPESVFTLYTEVLDDLPLGAGADLLARCVPAFPSSDDSELLTRLYEKMVTLAQNTTDAVWVERSRSAVRQAIRQSSMRNPDTWPVWVRADIPETLTEELQMWSDAPTWRERALLIRTHADEVFNQKDALDAITKLKPDHSLLQILIGLREPWKNGDLDIVLDSLVSMDTANRLLNNWLSTPTWEESQEFFQLHRDELMTDVVRDILMHIAADETSNPRRKSMANQHLAILQLAATQSADYAFSVAGDPWTAHSEIFMALRKGDEQQYLLVLNACPALATMNDVQVLRVLYGWIVTGSLEWLGDDSEQDVAKSVVQALSETDLQGLVTLLRSFARKRPEYEAITTKVLTLIADAVQAQKDQS